MIPVSTILACIFTLMVSLVLPVVILIVFAAKNKKQGIVSAWLLGAAGFFVTQILIRLPILTALQSQSWFIAFSQNHLFGYAFSLAFTAGLFELAGRYGVAKILQKKLTYKRALAAGLGHGGIEAIILVGITYVNNLICIFMVNSSAFDGLIAQTAAMGVDVSQLELIRTQLLSTSPVLFLLGGFERLLAMTAHLAMSVLVCYGAARKKTMPCVLLCLAIHTFIDLTAGISLLAGSVLSQGATYAIIYLILLAVAVFSVYVVKELGRRWRETEVTHE